jgi:hypothetical protein
MTLISIETRFRKYSEILTIIAFYDAFPGLYHRPSMKLDTSILMSREPGTSLMDLNNGVLLFGSAGAIFKKLIQVYTPNTVVTD